VAEAFRCQAHGSCMSFSRSSSPPFCSRSACVPFTRRNQLSHGMSQLRMGKRRKNSLFLREPFLLRSRFSSPETVPVTLTLLFARNRSCYAHASLRQKPFRPVSGTFPRPGATPWTHNRWWWHTNARWSCLGCDRSRLVHLFACFSCSNDCLWHTNARWSCLGCDRSNTTPLQQPQPVEEGLSSTSWT